MSFLSSLSIVFLKTVVTSIIQYNCVQVVRFIERNLSQWSSHASELCGSKALLLISQNREFPIMYKKKKETLKSHKPRSSILRRLREWNKKKFDILCIQILSRLLQYTCTLKRQGVYIHFVTTIIVLGVVHPHFT